jgi:hypothetical protein
VKKTRQKIKLEPGFDSIKPEQACIRYFSDELIEANFVLSLEPSPFTAEMIASAMPAAINPYSIAVAPDSSARNAFKTLIILDAPSKSMSRSETHRKPRANSGMRPDSALDG